jgi:phage terminase small subunit
MSLASKLTNRQLMFVAEYLVDQNGKAAAVRAGYSEQTAASIASENLTKPNIRLR